MLTGLPRCESQAKWGCGMRWIGEAGTVSGRWKGFGEDGGGGRRNFCSHAMDRGTLFVVCASRVGGLGGRDEEGGGGGRKRRWCVRRCSEIVV